MAVLNELVLPGQSLTEAIQRQLEAVKHLQKKDDGLSVRLGFGIKYSLEEGREEFEATVAGPLVFANPCRFWIACRRHVYYPMTGDLVLGVVTVKTGEYYKLDIGCAQPATLHATEGFSGANRRNRPNLQVGSVVFCRVTFSHRDVDPEVSCVDEEDLGLGYVKPTTATNLFHIPVSYAEDLQRPENFVLGIMGKHFAFEITVGCNGRFALESATPELTLALGNAIVDAELLPEKDVYAQVQAIQKQQQAKK
jgi:exosome complex component RRP40